jgi:hypothetical protein
LNLNDANVESGLAIEKDSGIVAGERGLAQKNDLRDPMYPTLTRMMV